MSAWVVRIPVTDSDELKTPGDQRTSGEDAGDAPAAGEDTADSGRAGEEGDLATGAVVAQLQAELEGSLARGLIPNGWEHRISWDAQDGGAKGAWVPALLLITAGSVAAGAAWGWTTGLSALFFSGGVALALSQARGPQIGENVRHTFTPPPETLFKAGIAGHTLVDVTRSRPFFFVDRIATRRDVWEARRISWLLALGFAVAGGLVVLERSATITPIAFLRVSAVVGAMVTVGFAAFAWRTYGRAIPHLVRQGPDEEHVASLGHDLLETATSGGSATDAFGRSLLSRLPPRALQVVVPSLILVTGMLPVLVAFNVTPDRSELWPGLTATAGLLVFIAAGLRALILLLLAAARRDGDALIAGVKTGVMLLVLLLAGRLFGWLDEWAAVIDWVRVRL